MTLDDVGPRTARVVTGDAREAAAAAVGPAADDLFLTAHADFAREVDFDDVHVLDLVADEGYEGVLLDACRRLHERGAPTLRVAVLPGSARALRTQLDRGAVCITEAERTDGSVLLTLGIRGDHGAAHDLLVLCAIDAAAASTQPDESRGTPRPELRSGPGSRRCALALENVPRRDCWASWTGCVPGSTVHAAGLSRSVVSGWCSRHCC